MFLKQNKGIKRKVAHITFKFIDSKFCLRLCVSLYVSELIPIKTQPIRGILCPVRQPRLPWHLSLLQLLLRQR